VPLSAPRRSALTKSPHASPTGQPRIISREIWLFVRPDPGPDCWMIESPSTLLPYLGPVDHVWQGPTSMSAQMAGEFEASTFYKGSTPHRRTA
jgi:hypothetical protein